jgi:F-type H+-transporting ATPase subunit b
MRFHEKGPGFSLNFGLTYTLFNKLQKMFSFFVLAIFLTFYSGVAYGASGNEHGGEHGGEHGPKGWVATDTYRVMNFVVLAGVIFLLARKPVSQVLNDRIKEIKDQLNELEEKKKSAERDLLEYNEKLSLLDKEAEKLIEEYIKQGNEAKARILEEAEIAAGKLEELAHRNIEREFKRTKIKLQEEIFEKALEKAEKIIKNKITSKDQEQLVDEYLDKVVA